MKTYHGIQNEFDTAEKVFEEIYNFLGRHPSEMVVASIKQVRVLFAFVRDRISHVYSQEDGTAGFQEKVFKLIDIHRQFWYLRPSLGTLGQARGKILLFSRFGSGYGCKLIVIYVQVKIQKYKSGISSADLAQQLPRAFFIHF